MRHKALIVLEALLQGERIIDGCICGREVEIEGRRWVLAKGFSGPVPAVIGTRESKGVTQETVLGTPDVSLAAFLVICEALSDDDAALIAGETVLNQS